MADYETPFFLLDLDRVRRKFEMVSYAFPGATIYYAVKANNHPEVLKALHEAGSFFDIGSRQEAELILELGVPPGNIIFSAPIKLQSHIRDTYERGIDLFVFDSEQELDKLALLAPGSRVMVRIAVGNEGSIFPLSQKFGCAPEQAPFLLRDAGELGLSPYGIAFHVGSQCTRKETWREALAAAVRVREECDKLGVGIPALNIGGGFPIEYVEEVPPIEDIAAEVLEAFEAGFPRGTELILEPGRYLVGDSAALASTVIGQAKRGDDQWLFLDASAFHGLLESLQVKGRFPYPVKTSREGTTIQRYVLSGPTCDPDDTIMAEVWLPELRVGDRVYILNTGAYSFVYASRFHGFEPPEIHVLSGSERALNMLWEESDSRLADIEAPEYGEENKYVLEQDGHVCKVYFNIRDVPDGWARALWTIYLESLHAEDAAQQQCCYTFDTFKSALADPDYINTVLTVDGEPLGLLLVTNNVEKAAVTYVNPDFLRKRYPRHVEEGRLFYITSVFISEKVRNLGFLRLFGVACFKEGRKWHGIMACDLSDDRAYLVDILINIAKEAGMLYRKRLLGTQSFFAIEPVFDREAEESPLKEPESVNRF